MFYQESYKCTIYKTNPSIVEKFDFFIGNLVGDMANKITVSLVADKIGVHYEVAKQLLLFYEENFILQKKFAIVCPNDNCNNILKIVTSDTIAETIEELNQLKFCIFCEDEYEDITKENVMVLFKRLKLFTTSQNEVNDTLINNKVIKNVIPSTESFFDFADSIDVNDIMKIYYNPSESAIEEMNKQYKSIGCKFSNTVEKGTSLEELVEYMFKQCRAFEVSRKYRTNTNQFDVTVKSLITFAKPSVLDELAPYFICECKNEKKIAGNTYFHKLYSILESTDGKVGILFSINTCAKTCNLIAREKFLISGGKIKLINITKNDLNKIIKNEIHLFDLLKEKIDALTLYSSTGLKLKRIDYK